MVKISVNAKVNLSLNITGLEANGYHSLDSVFASVALADVIFARKSDKIALSFSDKSVVVENSAAIKALSYMVSEFSLPGAEVEIECNIPSGAGLGGSSADCSGVIKAVNNLYSLGLSVEKMREIALKFGSDTGYMISGGFARIRGRGDKIEFFPSNFAQKVLIAYCGEVSTPESFRVFDALGVGGICSDNDALVEAMKKGDEAGVYANLGNALFAPSNGLNPSIGRVMELLPGCKCNMTGSGAGVVVFDRLEFAKNVLLENGYRVIETLLGNVGNKI